MYHHRYKLIVNEFKDYMAESIIEALEMESDPSNGSNQCPPYPFTLVVDTILNAGWFSLDGLLKQADCFAQEMKGMHNADYTPGRPVNLTGTQRIRTYETVQDS